MDQQKRFLLAMVLSGLVLIAWQYFFPQPPADASGTDPATQVVSQQQANGGTQAGGDTTPQVNPATEVPAAPQKVIAPRTDTLSSEMVTLSLSNKGALVTGISLKKPEQYQKAGDLLGALPPEDNRYPFAISFEKGAIPIHKDLTYEVVEASAAKIHYRHVDPNNRFVIDRTYAVNPTHPYLLDATLAITNPSATDSLSDRLVMTITGYEDPKEAEERSFLESRTDESEAICRSEDDLERHLHSQLEDPETLEGALRWGAVDTRYFFWGIIPEKQARKCRMSRDGGYVLTTLTWEDFSVGPKSTLTYASQIYTGPKDLDVLNEIGSDLNQSVDYGMLTVLAKPLRWLLVFFYSFVHNWGLAIILLTLLIKILTWPITEKSYANAERMKEIQPQLDALRAKHENDQQRLAEETMKLFSENKFNPLGGCLPMILQMPILYGLYTMIINSVELYHAEFALWYTDLSARDPYFILPLLMGAMMFIQQKWMTPESTAKGPNQQAMVMMKFMPIMFTAFMLFLPSGLVLYYSLNLVLGILQQWLIRRKYARRREAKQNQPTVV